MGWGKTRKVSCHHQKREQEKQGCSSSENGAQGRGSWRASQLASLDTTAQGLRTRRLGGWTQLTAGGEEPFPFWDTGPSPQEKQGQAVPHTCSAVLHSWLFPQGGTSATEGLCGQQSGHGKDCPAPGTPGGPSFLSNADLKPSGGLR